MSSNKQNILMLSIISVMIISIIIVALLLRLRTKEETGGSIADEYGKIENGGISKEAYFNINNCMEIYLSALNIDEQDSDSKQRIYNLLSESYILQNNITVNNVYSYVKTIKEDEVYVPLETITLQDKDITSFLIHGLLQDKEYNIKDEIFAIINIDVINELFSIEPISGEYSSVNNIKLKRVETEIKEKTDNKFVPQSISYEDSVRDYIDIYKRLAIGSPERMFNLLDKKYREAKFGNIDSFKRYVETNLNQIQDIIIEKYQAIETPDYTQYVCVDQRDNYYIIQERAVFNYSVLLDRNTIDIEGITDEFFTVEAQEVVSKLTNAEEYFEVKSTIQSYYTAIANYRYSSTEDEIGLGYAIDEIDEYYKQEIFDTLSNEYKKYKNITLDNLEQFYKDIDDVTVSLEEVLEYKLKDNITIYWVYGNLFGDRDFVKSEFKLMVVIDRNQACFSITPWDYVEQNGLANYEVRK